RCRAVALTLSIASPELPLLSKTGFGGHVPGCDDQQQDDQSVAPRPAPELPARLGVVVAFGSPRGGQGGAALPDGADQERNCEQAEPELHPELPEVPRVGVDDEADAETENGDGRRGKGKRSDHTQAAGEAA